MSGTTLRVIDCASGRTLRRVVRTWFDSADAERCAFCGRGAREVRKIIKGREDKSICDRCVALGAALLSKGTCA